MSDADDPERREQGPSGEDETRRAFLSKVGIGGASVGLGAVVAGPALGYVFFPVNEKVTSGGENYIEVGVRQQFGAEPVKVDVFADRVDAWNRVKQVKIGSAWIVESGEKLVAYSTVCPHLGCAIDYDAEVGKFKCPCHKSAFGLDGAREEGPSPRPMDELELDEQKETGLVSIKYRRFKQGTEDKEPV